MSIEVTRYRTICFSGHRTEKLPRNNKKFTNLILKLNLEIEKAILKVITHSCLVLAMDLT